MAHLTLSQRYTIECMHKKGYKQKAISEAINKDKSVVSRELRRNCDLRNNAYRSSLAHQKYTKRQKEKPRKRYFTSEIKAYIDDKLYKKFSPEQIVGTAKKNSVAMVSCQRIYQYIWEDKKQVQWTPPHPEGIPLGKGCLWHWRRRTAQPPKNKRQKV